MNRHVDTFLAEAADRLLKNRPSTYRTKARQTASTIIGLERTHQTKRIAIKSKVQEEIVAFARFIESD